MSASAPPADVKTKNLYEQIARGFLQRANEQAGKLAQATAEQPALSKPVAPAQLAELWHYSPAGNPQQAAEAFYKVHDAILAQQSAAEAQKPPEQRLPTAAIAHAAEQAGLEQVYPWRAKFLGVGVSSIDQMIKVADTIAGHADRRVPEKQLQALGIGDGSPWDQQMQDAAPAQQAPDPEEVPGG